MTRPSQTTAIRQALARGDRLTHLDAERRFGCLRLAARINELRRQGYRIDSRTVFEGAKHWTEYSMPGTTCGQARELAAYLDRPGHEREAI